MSADVAGPLPMPLPVPLPADRRAKPAVLAAAALVLVLAPCIQASAQLADADTAYEADRLADAGRAYEDALATGRLDRSEVARAHLRLGVVSALGEQPDLASRHFRIALALDPGAEAPARLDESSRERFEASRGERLRVVLSPGARDPEDELTPGLTVDVRGAPEGLVRTVEILGGGDFVRRFAWEGEAIRVDVPAAARPVEARALDAHGNVLATDGQRGVEPTHDVSPERAAIEAAGADEDDQAVSNDDGAAFGGPPPDPLPRAGGGEASVIESPWFWVVVGVIVAGVAVAVGFGASGQRYVVDAPVIR